MTFGFQQKYVINVSSISKMVLEWCNEIMNVGTTQGCMHNWPSLCLVVWLKKIQHGHLHLHWIGVGTRIYLWWSNSKIDYDIICVRCINLLFNQCLDIFHWLFTHVVLNMMIMSSKMNWCPHKGDEFMDDVVYFALTHAKAKWDTATKFVNKCPYRRTRGEMTCNRNMCGVTYPRDFILEIGLNKLNITIVLTSKVAHTFVITKTQTKVILDVGCLDLAPSMVVMLPIHALHLSKMPYWAVTRARVWTKCLHWI